MTSASRTRRWTPYLAILTAMALWGSSFPAFKFALSHFDGWFLTWARMLLAGVLCLAFLPFSGVVRPSPREWKLLALMGICEPCLYFIFEVNALRYTSSAQAGVIVALLPLLVAGAAAVFLGERLTRRVIAGLSMALVGAIWMSLSSGTTEASPRPLLGNFLEFCAMVCATGYVLAIKHLTTRHSPLSLVLAQNVIGVAFFLPFVLLGDGLPAVGEVPALAWGSLVYLGSAVSLFAFYCHNVALRHIPASRASAFGNLIPVFAIVLSVSLLGERFSWVQVAATGLILLGLGVSQRERSSSGPGPTGSSS